MIPKRLLPQQLTHRPMTGRTSFGPVYGDLVTVPARVQFGVKTIQTANGEEAVSSATSSRCLTAVFVRSSPAPIRWAPELSRW